MNLQKYKNLFLKALIGCLAAAAVVAIAAILSGHFNSILSRAIWTILVVALHCLVSFGFITNNEKKKQLSTFSFFTDVFFVFIIFSFATATLGIWRVLQPEWVAKLYGLYVIVLFASLHAEILSKIRQVNSKLTNLIFASIGFIVIVALMLSGVDFSGFSNHLGTYYYRILAACGVVDATLSLITVILYKLYLMKHPGVVDPLLGQETVTVQTANGQPLTIHKKHSILRIVVFLVGLYLLLQVASFIYFSIVYRQY